MSQAKALFREGRARIRLKPDSRAQEHHHARAFELEQLSFQNTTLLARVFCLLWGLRGKLHREPARSAFQPCCGLELPWGARQGWGGMQSGGGGGRGKYSLDLSLPAGPRTASAQTLPQRGKHLPPTRFPTGNDPLPQNCPCSLI